MGKLESLKTSDAESAGHLLPEVFDFTFFHLPEDENAVIGFRFDVRLGPRFDCRLDARLDH